MHLHHKIRQDFEIFLLFRFTLSSVLSQPILRLFFLQFLTRIVKLDIGVASILSIISQVSYFYISKSDSVRVGFYKGETCETVSGR